MNKELLMDAISCLDGDLLAEHLKRKEELRRNPKRKSMPLLLKCSVVAASIALTVTGAFFVGSTLFDDPPVSTDQPIDINALLPSATDKPTEDNTSCPTDPIHSETNVELLCLPTIRVDNRFYVYESDLSEQATEESVGDFLGVVFLNGYVDKTLSAYEYLPSDNEKNRVILQYGDKFYVYEFYQYNIEDDNAEYPTILLERAVKVGVDDGVLDPSLMTDWDYFKFAEIEDREGIIKLLVDIAAGEKYDSEYMDDYIFGGDKETDKRRYIRVTLEDKTYLQYEYIVGSGTLTFGTVGYILTDEQNEELRFLIGMD